MKTTKISRQVSVGEDQFQKIDELRKKLGVSFSAFTRIALQEYLQKVGEKNEKRKSQEGKDCR